MKRIMFFLLLVMPGIANEAFCQWTINGNNINNSNSGNVGIGTSAPITLLHVGKSVTEPTITIQNFGGTGGATYTMIDNTSGANWKFKATLSGGFKIRDHANSLDVFVIEPGTFANAIYIKNTDNIGIGTSTPDASALMDVNSTSKGFLIPRMTQSQIEAVPEPADGLQVYCTTDGKLYIYVALDSQWKEVAYGTSTFTPPFSCGMSLHINHVTGNVAPVDKTTTYGTVSDIPGEPTKCWITSNLGSDHQATAVNDATEASAGWYWQFNLMQGYMAESSTPTPAWTITSINEDSEWIPANDPCTIELGNGWRIPTSTEWTNVKTAGGWTTWTGPWESDLKLHAGGDITLTGGLLAFRGSQGYFRSSTQYDNANAWMFAFASGQCNIFYSFSKVYGMTIRCIKE